MSQEEKKVKVELADEQMGDVSGGMIDPSQWDDVTKWQTAADQEGRGIGAIPTPCAGCGTPNSTFASSMSEDDYVDCKCYNCGLLTPKLPLAFADGAKGWIIPPRPF